MWDLVDTLVVAYVLFRVLEFYPVSVIRVTLGIHVSFICHRPYIILVGDSVVK
jgi:hypothetical protein